MNSLAFIMWLMDKFPCLVKWLKLPRLKAEVDKQPSQPSDHEKKQGVKPSTFLRLKITNAGYRPAKGCYGRLLEVQDEAGERVEIFDPLNLYWERQGGPDEYEQVDIGCGDSYFLDVAQANENTNTIDFRVVISKGHRLITSDKYPGAKTVRHGHQMPRGTYRLRIAVYAEEGVRIRPTWYKVGWEKEREPYIIKDERDSLCHRLRQRLKLRS